MTVDAQTVGTRGRLVGNAQLRGHFGRIPFALAFGPASPAEGGNLIEVLGARGNKLEVGGGGNTVTWCGSSGNSVVIIGSNTIEVED